MRAVSLIWQLEKSTKSSHLESIVAQSISLSSSSLDIQSSCEAFGVLWRLTGTYTEQPIWWLEYWVSIFIEDSLLPGFRLQVPMMLVLDTLKSEDPNLRRVGETWMRCSLRTYLRYDTFSVSLTTHADTIKGTGTDSLRVARSLHPTIKYFWRIQWTPSSGFLLWKTVGPAIFHTPVGDIAVCCQIWWTRIQQNSSGNCSLTVC